jgi:hypothetical protein
MHERDSFFADNAKKLQLWRPKLRPKVSNFKRAGEAARQLFIRRYLVVKEHSCFWLLVAGCWFKTTAQAQGRKNIYPSTLARTCARRAKFRGRNRYRNSAKFLQDKE